MAIELLVTALTAFVVFRWFPEASARREWVLVTVSAAMIAYWQPLALLVSLLLTLGAWALMREQLRRRMPMAPLVAGLVLALVLFRQAPTLGSVSPGASRSWAVPLGISFLVFRLIGAAMDASALQLSVGPRQILLLCLLFPTFRSGPLTTLSSLEPLSTAQVDLGHAVDRIVLGLARKRLLADSVDVLVLQPWVSAGAAALSPEQCLLLPFVWGMWIYWDFAGYSDMAIGTAALLGYRVPENFDRPYLSRNILEFWRRWHITLSDWIRTRVFLKLTGRRPSAGRIYAAAVLSMVVFGLWHGIAGGFIVWGLWHGLAVAAVLALRATERKHPASLEIMGRRWTAWLATAFTFLYVNVGWLPFFLPLPEAWRTAVKGAGALLHVRGPLLLIGVVTAVLLVSQSAAWLWARGVPAPVRGMAYALVLVAAFVFAGSPQPFVYFRF